MAHITLIVAIIGAIALIVMIVVLLKYLNSNKPVTNAMLKTAEKFEKHIEESEKKDVLYEKYMKASTDNVEIIKDVFVEVRQLIHEQGAQLVDVKKIIVRHENRLDKHDDEIEKVKCKVKRLEDRP